MSMALRCMTTVSFLLVVFCASPTFCRPLPTEKIKNVHVPVPMSCPPGEQGMQTPQGPQCGACPSDACKNCLHNETKCFGNCNRNVQFDPEITILDGICSCQAIGHYFSTDSLTCEECTLCPDVKPVFVDECRDNPVNERAICSNGKLPTRSPTTPVHATTSNPTRPQTQSPSTTTHETTFSSLSTSNSVYTTTALVPLTTTDKGKVTMSTANVNTHSQWTPFISDQPNARELQNVYYVVIPTVCLSVVAIMVAILCLVYHRRKVSKSKKSPNDCCVVLIESPGGATAKCTLYNVEAKHFEFYQRMFQEATTSTSSEAADNSPSISEEEQPKNDYRGEMNSPLMLALAKPNDQDEGLSHFVSDDINEEQQATEQTPVQASQLPVQAGELSDGPGDSEEEGEVSREVVHSPPDYTTPNGRPVGLHRVVFNNFSSLHYIKKGKVTAEEFKTGAIAYYNLAANANGGEQLVRCLEPSVMWQLACILDIPGDKDYQCLIHLCADEITSAELRNEYLHWCGMPTLKLLTCSSIQQLQTGVLLGKFIELGLSECSALLTSYVEELTSSQAQLTPNIVQELTAGSHVADDLRTNRMNPGDDAVTIDTSPATNTASSQSGGMQLNYYINNSSVVVLSNSSVQVTNNYGSSDAASGIQPDTL